MLVFFFLPTTAVQERQHLSAAGCRTFFSRLIRCVFLILCTFLVGSFIFVVDALHPIPPLPPGYGPVGNAFIIVKNNNYTSLGPKMWFRQRCPNLKSATV